jgi:hypothetical protein
VDKQGDTGTNGGERVGNATMHGQLGIRRNSQVDGDWGEDYEHVVSRDAGVGSHRADMHRYGIKSDMATLVRDGVISDIRWVAARGGSALVVD